MSRLEKIRTLNSLLLKEALEDSQCCVVSGPAFAAVSQRNSDIRIFALETAVSRFSDVMWVMHRGYLLSGSRLLTGLLCYRHMT